MRALVRACVRTQLFRALFGLALPLTFTLPCVAAAGSATWQPEASFEKNLGQLGIGISYRTRLARVESALSDDGSLVIAARTPATSAKDSAASRFIRLSPLNGSQNLSIRESGRTKYKTSYFRGGEHPVTVADVPHFSGVTFRSIYPGIDLKYHIADERIEYDYVISPNADPSKIGIRIDGATEVEVDASGALEIKAGNFVLHQRKPIAYQDNEHGRTGVECEYRLVDGHTVKLALGRYDKRLPLIIDPIVDYSSLLGGSGIEWLRAFKIGPGGYIYVAGDTESTDFPIVNAYDSSIGNQDTDAFVTKINPATGKAVYSTFLGGGRGNDSVSGIAVDADGSVYVTGTAGTGFPTTAGAYQTSATAPVTFITKLAPAGNALVYSTFLIGTHASAIAVDSSGHAIVAGTAGTAFITTPAAFQPTFAGGSSDPTAGDAFAFVLNASGSSPIFATFFGGSGNDSASGTAVDGSNNVVIVGATSSPDLPMTGAVQASTPSTASAFLAMFPPSGSSLTASTYYGGSGQEAFNDVAIDRYGNIVVAGDSESRDLSLVNPLLSWSDLTFRSYFADSKGLVVKYSPPPLRILFSTLVGSRSHSDVRGAGAESVAVDFSGDIYISGSIWAQDYDLFDPVHPFLNSDRLNPNQLSHESYLAYAQGISRDGTRIRFRTVVAGYSDHTKIAARDTGQVAYAGYTSSGWYPIAAINGRAVNSNYLYDDGFVMTLNLAEPPLSLAASSQTANATQPVSLIATDYSGQTSGSVTFWDGTTSLGSAALTQGVASLAVNFGAGIHNLSASLNSTQSPVVLLPVTPSAATCP